MKKGLFPGSFDPFTKGHEAIVLKTIHLFDEIFIGIGINSNKKYLFDPGIPFLLSPIGRGPIAHMFQTVCKYVRTCTR